jgi:hypothetical protein
MDETCICPECYVELDEDDGEMCNGCTYFGCSEEKAQCI